MGKFAILRLPTALKPSVIRPDASISFPKPPLTGRVLQMKPSQDSTALTLSTVLTGSAHITPGKTFLTKVRSLEARCDNTKFNWMVLFPRDEDVRPGRKLAAINSIHVYGAALKFLFQNVLMLENFSEDFEDFSKGELRRRYEEWNRAETHNISIDLPLKLENVIKGITGPTESLHVAAKLFIAAKWHGEANELNDLFAKLDELHAKAVLFFNHIRK
jgi:hypothetical protein